MSSSRTESLTTPLRDDLGLVQIANGAGVSVSVLPSGAIFAIEHIAPERRIMINQVLSSPLASGLGRVFLRVGGGKPAILPVIGPEGGLAPEELAAAHRAGFRNVRLGPRVLRTETVGVAAMAAMNALWGDWR